MFQSKTCTACKGHGRIPDVHHLYGENGVVEICVSGFTICYACRGSGIVSIINRKGIFDA